MSRTSMAVTAFDGADEFLSNFFRVPVTHLGVVYPEGSEYAYHAQKFSDPAHKALIMQCRTPGRAKLCAYRLSEAGHQIPGWHDMKLGVMESVLRAKFSLPDLRKRLRDTKPLQLIEGNTWRDTYWGVCNGKGENHLGKLLMKIRDERK